MTLDQAATLLPWFAVMVAFIIILILLISIAGQLETLTAAVVRHQRNLTNLVRVIENYEYRMREREGSTNG